MTPADSLDDLEAVARAATEGEWRYPGEVLGQPSTTVMAGNHQVGYVAVGHFLKHNATHIATFDPPTVLELIARLRKSEAAVEAVRAECDKWDMGEDFKPIDDLERGIWLAIGKVHRILNTHLGDTP